MTTLRHSSAAVALLERLAYAEPAVIGDLEESHRGGRSRGWLWGQVIGLVALSARRRLLEAPVQVIGGLVVGWGVLISVCLLGDTIAYGLASAIWDWSRAAGYEKDWWWPFQVTATVVSYGGFVASAWAVARLRVGGPLVVLHTASVFIGLVLAAIVIEALTTTRGGVPVPHPLFYFLHVTLPYQGWAGIGLVPLSMLFVGMLAAEKRRPLGDAIV